MLGTNASLSELLNTAARRLNQMPDAGKIVGDLGQGAESTSEELEQARPGAD
jgi:hypothetical protein